MYEQNPMIGPGSAGLWNHTLEILLLLLVAFILGYILRWAIGRMQIETQKRELDVEHRHRRALESDFDRVRAEHSAMGSRISTLEGDLNRERAQLAEGHQKIEQSTGQIAALKTELGAYPSQLENVRNELATALASTAKAPEQSAELNKLRAQASRFDDLKGDLIGARTELSAALAGREAMQAEIDRLRSELDAQRLQAKPRASNKPDDLKVIEGIGPKINELLLAAGIRSFVELSDTPIDRLKKILDDAGDRYRIHDLSTWPQQAKLCAIGDWDALRELQDKLVAGRNS